MEGDEFDLSVPQFFRIFYGDNTQFPKLYHDARNDKGQEISTKFR